MNNWQKERSKEETKNLILLKIHEGLSFWEAVEAAGVPRTTAKTWRMVDSEFEKGIKREEKHTKGFRLAKRASQVEVVKDHYEHPKRHSPQWLFLINYTKHRDRAKACRELRIPAYMVEEWMTKDDPNYDEDFDKLMRSHELEQLWDLDDSMMDAAQEDMSLSKFVLEKRLPHKYGRPAVNKTEHTIFWTHAQGQDKARSTLIELCASPIDTPEA